MSLFPRCGLELPPFAVPPGPVSPSWGDTFTAAARALEAADRSGFDAVWVADGPDAGGFVEPCTVAGGLAATTSTAVLGVVADVAHHRHPAVLARDLNAVDLVSGGRAAIVLADGHLHHPGGPGLPGRLGEAVSIVRGLFAGSPPPRPSSPTHFRWPVAVLRPPPRPPSGPALAVFVPSRAVAVAHRAPLGELVRAADAMVVDGNPEEVAAACRAIRSAAGGAAAAGARPVLWRGGLPPSDHDGAALLGELAAAGIGGVICRTALGDVPSPGEVQAVGRLVRRAFGAG